MVDKLKVAADIWGHLNQDNKLLLKVEWEVDLVGDSVDLWIQDNIRMMVL